MAAAKQWDAGIIGEIAPLAVQDYEFLRYTNGHTVKDAFLAEALEEPMLRYGDAALAEPDLKLEAVHALGPVVAALGSNVLRRAYEPKLRELREKYEFLRAARDGNDRGVFDASIRMYGKPREDLFNYSLRGLRERMAAVRAAFGTEPLVAEALDTLGPLAARYRDEHYSWDDVELPSVRRYAALAPLTAQAIRERLEDAFAAHGIDGWRAVVDAPGERTTFSTNHELRTIFIPSDDDMANRKYALTEDRVRAVVAHEVGTHVLRRTNAERGPLALLAVGLADYLRGEEGVATYAEQKLDGARHYAGGLGYLSVGLAVGLDGTPRTFRGLFDMLRPYMLVSSLEHALAYEDPVDLAALSARVERRAWARSVRTFRGTTGATPGACFTKDIVYREGNIAVWELVAADPAWDEMFTVGKYDPANTEHVGILKELGVL